MERCYWFISCFVVSVIGIALSLETHAQEKSNKPRAKEQKVGSSDSAAFVRQGRQTFNSFCSRCHGIDGKGAKGPNLTSGRFRHAETDEDLVDIMANGVPGTGMPGFGENLEDLFYRPIVAYLRDAAKRNANAKRRGPMGDVKRGQTLFQKHKCASCHWNGSGGGRVGTDLSRLSATFDYVRKALLEPDAQVSAEYEPVVIILDTGQVVQGRRLYENAYFVLLMDDKERFQTIDKSAIEAMTRPTKSLMPSFKMSLTEQDVRDLVQYISTLQKGSR